MQTDQQARPRQDKVGWLIPWQGGSAHLTVKRAFWSSSSALLVDGREVARTPRPTLERPWVECSVPGTNGRVVVVQLQPEAWVVWTRVFVDGLSADDGLTLDAWRLRRPMALDKFEQGFRARVWGPVGAVLVGVIAALPALIQLERTPAPIWVVMAAGGFAISAGWMWAMIRLSRWLRGKPTWPWRLRRAVVVVGVLLGVPVLILLAAQAVYLLQRWM
jgi:hypothetical protein